MSSLNIQLIHGECLEVMDVLISKGITVDAIITDPPYGTTSCKWDSIIPFDEMWTRLNKLIKPNGAIVLFGTEPFSSMLRVSNLKNYKYDWAWRKNPIGFLNSKKRPLITLENISIFYENGATYNPQGLVECRKKVKRGKQSVSVGHDGGRLSTSEYTQKFTNFPNQILDTNGERGLHPTQKPIALMEYLIKTYTNEGETILDFTMGSGSTMVACNNTNRRGIGIELDEGYFNIAAKRINEQL